MANQKRRAFTREYKAEVVELCRKSGKSIGAIAKDLGLAETAVRRWVQQADVDGGKGPAGALTTAEREELSVIHAATTVTERLAEGLSPSFSRAGTPTGTLNELVH